MEYLLLILGLLLIGYINRDSFKSKGVGDLSILKPIFVSLLFIILWLIVFFVLQDTHIQK